MRLALQALFCKSQNLSNEDIKRRSRIENELRNSPRSSGFYKKLRQTLDSPLKKAPEVFADESFPDANIVAEYLDCQLDSCEISDEYEHVCYESPEILAEVADCYDILNNRLCEPMEAPKNCRHRLYYVAWEEETPRSQKSGKKNSRPQEEHVYEAEYAPRAATTQGPSIDVEVSRAHAPKAAPKKKRNRQENHESDVQKKMRSHRGAGKRFFGWCVKGCLAFFIVAGGINGYARWRGSEDMTAYDVPTEAEAEDVYASETAPLNCMDNADFLAAELEDDVVRYDSMAYVTEEADYYPAPELERTSREYQEYDRMPESEPVEVASLPMEPVAEIASSLYNAPETTAPRTRRGLSSGDGRREGIEIPDVNHDALFGVQRF